MCAYLMWCIRALAFLLFWHDIPVAVFATFFRIPFWQEHTSVWQGAW
jgi:hypothetical protein